MFWRVPILAVVHLGLILAAAFIAYGWDLDHLTSHSTLSQVAQSIHAALLLPLAAIGPSASRSPLSVPLEVVFANSGLWAVAGYCAWRLFRRFAGKRASAEHNAA